MRTKQIPDSGLFSAPELEDGCLLPSRSLEFLKREGLMSPPRTEGGRGRTALYGFGTLEHLALTSVFTRELGSMVIAAKMAHAIVRGAGEIYGLLPFGLNDEGRKVSDKIVMPPRMECREDDIVVLYEAIREAGGFAGEPLANRNDMRVAITDRRFVFATYLMNVFGALEFEGLFYEPLMELPDTARGNKESLPVTFESICADAGENRREAVKQRYFDARIKSEAAIHLNLSLTVRKALGRIYMARESLRRSIENT